MKRISMLCVAIIIALSVTACTGVDEDAEIHVQSDGLSIQDKRVGEGAVAIPGKKLTVDYTGWYWEGRKKKKFHDSGKPITFTLGRGEVIRGWDRGLKGMKTGGFRWLGVPKHLGYGRGSSEKGIPPNAILWFDVELLEVK